jgi:hypothetical protein
MFDKGSKMETFFDPSLNTHLKLKRHSLERVISHHLRSIGQTPGRARDVFYHEGVRTLVAYRSREARRAERKLIESTGLSLPAFLSEQLQRLARRKGALTLCGDTRVFSDVAGTDVLFFVAHPNVITSVEIVIDMSLRKDPRVDQYRVGPVRRGC